MSKVLTYIVICASIHILNNEIHILKLNIDIDQTQVKETEEK